MHRFAMVEVAPDRVVGVEDGERLGTEPLARRGGTSLVVLDSGSRGSRISQRGAVLRRHVDHIGRAVSASPREMHLRTVVVGPMGGHPEMYGSVY